MAYFAHIGGFVFGLLDGEVCSQHASQRDYDQPRYPLY